MKAVQGRRDPLGVKHATHKVNHADPAPSLGENRSIKNSFLRLFHMGWVAIYCIFSGWQPGIKTQRLSTLYNLYIVPTDVSTMTATAAVFMSGNSLAVRLPKALQLKSRRVTIERRRP